MGVWGGRESGAERSLGRKGSWGGWESASGAEGSLGRKGVWGGWESGAEGSLERKGLWGGLGPNGVWGGREPWVDPLTGGVFSRL